MARSEITQILINPAVKDTQIISSSVDGNLSIWNWSTGQFIRCFKIKLPIHSMTIKSFSVETGDIEFLVVSLRLKGPVGCNLPDPKRLFYYANQKMTSLIELVRINLNSNLFVVKQLFKARGLSRLALSPSCDEFMFSSKNEIKFCDISKEVTEFTITRSLSHTTQITRLQYHPTEPCVVLSDRLGQIIMWYCLRSESVTATFPQRTLHWHANEVTDFIFTSNGQYLLSGGEEAVLVLWQIENSLRQYLPRLGDPIHFVVVSADDRWVAVSTRDNAVHLVSLTSGSNLTVKHSIRGCHQSSSRINPILLPGNSSLLLSSAPGNLQMFDPVKDCVQGVLEIAPQNRKTGFAAEKRHKCLEIVKTAVSSCGNWMVTLEQRNSSKTSQVILTSRLKFWCLKEHSWILLSVVDRPHNGLVTDLCIWMSSNGIPTAASSSRDGTFKIWSIDMKHGIWTCAHVGSYHDVPSGATSVSVNHSATCLAVAYGPSVTLWSLVSEVRLMDVLMTSQSAVISEARFMSESDGLVAWCPDMGTFVFTMAASSDRFLLSWHSPVSPKAPIALHPTKSQFAMLIDTAPSSESDNELTGILAYNIHSPIPVGYYLLPKQCASYDGVSYVPSPQDVKAIRRTEAETHILVLFDGEKGDFTLLSTELASKVNRVDFNRRIKPTQVVKSTEPLESALHRSRSLYKAIFDSPDGRTHNDLLDSRAQSVKHTMAELFAAVSQSRPDELLLPLVASHVLPPVGMLFTHFIQNTLKKKTQ